MKEENTERARNLMRRLTRLRLHLKDFGQGVTSVKSITGVMLNINDPSTEELSGTRVSEDCLVIITTIVCGPIRREIEALEKELATL